MRADNRFRNESKEFWAVVRSVSQAIGYTDRGTKLKPGGIKAPSLQDIADALVDLDLSPDHLISGGHATKEGSRLEAYFAYRADVLNKEVEPLLMDQEEAAALFRNVFKTVPKWVCPFPENKQKGEKAGSAYLTGLVNMIFEMNVPKDIEIDYDPKKLTTFTRDAVPLRTFARRVDGCFPRTVNPIGVWEIKEYYFTTTFGSRVADGVYETLLDGMEIEELREHEKIDVQHLLVIDSHFTWWVSGRSYLCRMIDMLHMGYVDEILFGKEVVQRLPVIVREWVDLYRLREKANAETLTVR